MFLPVTGVEPSQLDPHLRRERELASLYATARSLTVLQEVDDVLTAIVRNAHDLVATDVTYLSVTEGHLYVTVGGETLSGEVTRHSIVAD